MTEPARDNLTQATACFENGDLVKAEELCRSVLRVLPNDAGAHVLLGKIYAATTKPELAQAEYRSAVNAEPTCVEAWRQWAALLKTHDHSKEAEICLREGLKFTPQSSALHNDLGMILLAQGDTDGAARHLEEAEKITPTSISALSNLGIVRKAQGRFDDAISLYRKALAIAPDVPELHNNLGDTLKMLDMDAAIEAFKAALRLRPDYPEALCSLGVAYFCKNKLVEALEKFDRAQRLKPEFNRAVAHKGIILFLLGRLPEAWALHRRRFELEGVKVPLHGRFPLPIWNGESLAGRSLLVWTEQGLGEEILQASMFHDARSAVSRLTVECTPRVFSLFRRSFPDIEFIKRTNPSRASDTQVPADYQIAAGDLGGIFRRNFSDFPNHSGYLIADSEKVEKLKRKYRDRTVPFVVGISWASYNADLGKEKTLALGDLAPILRQSYVKFVNLQYREAPGDVAAVERALGINILTDEAIDPLGDIDDIAAQVAALDLVISVSNTVVHIAGALNVPVWNIVPAYNASGMWHWFHDVETSPWYPSMRIYRRREKNVGPLVEKIAQDLRDFVEKSMD